MMDAIDLYIAAERDYLRLRDRTRGMSSRAVAEWAIEQAKLPGTWEEKVAAVMRPSDRGAVQK